MPRWRKIEFAARGVFVPERGFVAIFCRKRRTGSGALSRLRRECVSRASRGRRTQAHRVASVAFARGAAFRGRFRRRSERGGERRSGGMAKKGGREAGRGRSRVVPSARGARVLGRGGQRLGGARARNRWREGRDRCDPEAKEARPRRRESTDPEMRGARALGCEGHGFGAPAREGRASGPFCAAALDRAIGRLLYWVAAFVARVLRARHHVR